MTQNKIIYSILSRYLFVFEIIDDFSFFRLEMVTNEKPHILNCNIQFYFKSIERTITFDYGVLSHSLNVMVCTIHLK